VARCTVARLMKQLGLGGVVRGATTRTTRPAPTQALPDDRVRRHFRAETPNRLWVADLTYANSRPHPAVPTGHSLGSRIDCRANRHTQWIAHASRAMGS